MQCHTYSWYVESANKHIVLHVPVCHTVGVLEATAAGRVLPAVAAPAVLLPAVAGAAVLLLLLPTCIIMLPQQDLQGSAGQVTTCQPS